MAVKDRFLIGFIAGVTGGVVMCITDHISYALGIAELRFIDWSSMMIYGERTDTIGEILAAQWGQLIFSGFTGIVFAYLVIGTTSKYFYLKGIIYAHIVWFFSYATVALFNITPILRVRLDTVLSNIVSVTIFGLVLAFVHKKLYFSAEEDIREKN